MLRIGSLFAGIGGLDLGVEHATRGRVLWQVERDPWCRKVLARHWPDAQRYDDVCTVATEVCRLAEVDLVCGGFPCQPVSLAGAREGIDDARWLWPEFERVLRVVRPRFALLENVRGILSANGGRALGDVLGGLARLGYTAEWDLFRASDVGAPHRRERWFCLAYRDGRGEQQPQGRVTDERGWSGDGGAELLGDAAGARREGLAGSRCKDSRQLSEVVGGGSGGVVADPERVSVQRRGGPDGVARASGDAQGEARQRQRQRGRDAAGGGGEDRSGVAQGNPEGEGLQGHGHVSVGAREALSGQRSARGRGAQPLVGRGADGLPGGLDAHRWPAGRGEPQHAWEPPRTSKATPNRRARLKALGNAVVPQKAALALRVLSARAGVGAELTAPRDGATSAEEVCDG